jgi:hypothetical protein
MLGECWKMYGTEEYPAALYHWLNYSLYQRHLRVQCVVYCLICLSKRGVRPQKMFAPPARLELATSRFKSAASLARRSLTS